MRIYVYANTNLINGASGSLDEDDIVIDDEGTSKESVAGDNNIDEGGDFYDSD